MSTQSTSLYPRLYRTLLLFSLAFLLFFVSVQKTDAASVNGVATFNGGSDYIQVPDSPSLHITNAITIEAWVKRTNFNTPYDWQQLINKSTYQDSYGVLFNQGMARFYLNGVNNTRYFSIDTPAGTFAENIWYHVAFTYDGSKAIIYVNGTEIRRANVSGPILSSNSPILIGGGTGVYGYPLPGSIDELRLWNAARTQQEIQAKSIGLDSASYALTVGGMAHNTAVTATNTDNSTSDVTALASYTSSSPSVATVSSAGVVNRMGVGITVIKATYEGKTAAAVIRIYNSILDNTGMHIDDNAKLIEKQVDVTGDGYFKKDDILHLLNLINPEVQN